MELAYAEELITNRPINAIFINDFIVNDLKCKKIEKLFANDYETKVPHGGFQCCLKKPERLLSAITVYSVVVAVRHGSNRMTGLKVLV